MTIDDIESFTYKEAKKRSIETVVIKGHKCMLMNLPTPFGYSILVFNNGKHVYCANDYELHHLHLAKTKGREALRQCYVDQMNEKLYTDEELLQDINSYKEYRAKQHFLRNYRIMQYDHAPAHSISDEEREMYHFFNPVCGCYVKDVAVVKESVKFLKHLDSEFNKLKRNDTTFREMVACELSNHEARITCDATPALEALGLRYSELSDTQKQIVKEELNKQATFF